MAKSQRSKSTISQSQRWSTVWSADDVEVTSADDVAVTSADDVAVMMSPRADVARGTWRVTTRGGRVTMRGDA